MPPAPTPPLHVEGTLTVSTNGAAVRITGGPEGQLRVEIDDLATLQKLRELANALPGPGGGAGPSKREQTRRAAEALDRFGLTATIVLAGQPIATVGRGVTAGAVSKLMNLGPIDISKSAVLKLGGSLFTN